MLSCHSWLSADFLSRRGFTLTVDGFGRRWAARAHQRFEIDPKCSCGPDVCPPLSTTYVSLEEAA